MNTIQEALKAVQEYDQIHWVHKQGSESIRHICISLMAASTQALGYKIQLINLDVVPTLIRQGWCAVIPGILIESAFRLANNCPGIDFEDYIFQGNPFVNVKRSEFENRILRKRWVKPEKFTDLLLVYFHSLTRLFEACEQIDSGKEFDKLYVLDVADGLLDFAAEFCPDTLNSIEDFFALLENRLKTKIRT